MNKGLVLFLQLSLYIPSAVKAQTSSETKHQQRSPISIHLTEQKIQPSSSGQIQQGQKNIKFEDEQFLKSDSKRSSLISHGTGYGGFGGGWSNSGYGNTGGISCTVCPLSIDPSYSHISQRCCSLGYRQCCQGFSIQPSPVYNNVLARPTIGAGYNYLNPAIYSSNSFGYSSFGEKPGSCYYNAYNNNGYRSGSSFGYKSGYYITKRSDTDHEQDAAVIDLGHSGYEPPRSKREASFGYSGGHSHSGYQSGGFHGGYGPPSSYCRRDFDCPGIQKCCAGTCANPVANLYG